MSTWCLFPLNTNYFIFVQKFTCYPYNFLLSGSWSQNRTKFQHPAPEMPNSYSSSRTWIILKLIWTSFSIVVWITVKTFLVLFFYYRLDIMVYFTDLYCFTLVFSPMKWFISSTKHVCVCLLCCHLFQVHWCWTTKVGISDVKHEVHGAWTLNGFSY